MHIFWYLSCRVCDPSLGSLEIGSVLLLGEPGISSGGWQLWCFFCNSATFFVCSFCCSVFFLIFYFYLSMPVIILKSSASIYLHVHSTSCRYMVFLHLFCLCFPLSSSQYVLASYVSVYVVGMWFSPLAASRKAAKSCSANREYLGRLATWVLLLQLRYIFCPHILLSYIVYNIFLVLVHASHSTE